MAEPVYPRLHMRFLWNAFWLEEGEERDGYVFAVIGRAETIKAVGAFCEAETRHGRGLFGRPLLVSNSPTLPEGVIRLAVHKHGRGTNVHDAPSAMLRTPLKPGAKPTTDVWATDIDLREEVR